MVIHIALTHCYWGTVSASQTGTKAEFNAKAAK